MDYSNLKNKTIFDFCNNVRILRFITRKTNPNKYEYVKKNNQDNCILDLRLLAFLTDNKKLNSALFNISPLIIEWNIDVFDFKDKLREKGL